VDGYAVDVVQNGLAFGLGRRFEVGDVHRNGAAPSDLDRLLQCGKYARLVAHVGDVGGLGRGHGPAGVREFGG